jgi:hypothetical protein
VTVGAASRAPADGDECAKAKTPTNRIVALRATQTTLRWVLRLAVSSVSFMVVSSHCPQVTPPDGGISLAIACAVLSEYYYVVGAIYVTNLTRREKMWLAGS